MHEAHMQKSIPGLFSLTKYNDFLCDCPWEIGLSEKYLPRNASYDYLECSSPIVEATYINVYTLYNDLFSLSSRVQYLYCTSSSYLYN